MQNSMTTNQRTFQTFQEHHPECGTRSAFHSTKTSEIFETETNGTEISREKFQKIRKLLNFRKANHSTENSSKFRDENQMERKFPGKYVRKFRYTSRGCPLFRKLCKFAIFYSALVLLAAMTASWTSHARVAAARIWKLKCFRIFPLIFR